MLVLSWYLACVTSDIPIPLSSTSPSLYSSTSTSSSRYLLETGVRTWSTPSGPNQFSHLGEWPLTFEHAAAHKQAIALLIALDLSYTHIYNMSRL